MNKDIKTIIAFDLDGILVNNVAFEHAVTKYIIHFLGHAKDISLEMAQKEWERVLQLNKSHPRWHDYSLHCEELGIGGVWKEAHLKNVDLLKKYEHVDDIISIAKQQCECWIITDATEWVANFKLNSIGHSASFSEVFSSSRCGCRKNSEEFWDQIASSLSDKSQTLIFIENRIDNIHVAKRHLKRCFPIEIRTPDHPNEIGFFNIDASSRHGNDVLFLTHYELKNTLTEIIKDSCLSR